MKKLFTSLNSAEAGLLKDIIESEEIPCFLRNEMLLIASGELPVYYPELWILNDEDYEKARKLLNDWLEPQEASRDFWVCPKCGEQIEGQFASCWKCAEPER
ncbi:DUF2007 domain-containing protein [Candidatus Poribacteria bacterium]|nr:DUF2007 domain-containing protein [Candidatus Poribacteria bacterium]